MWLFFHKGLTWSLAVFLVASVTDVLDGYIARRYNLVTKFGKLLDPLADKSMLITVLICLNIGGRLPLWMLIFVCVKEAAMLIGALVLLNKGNVVAANFLGKATTATFTLGIVSAFIFEPGFWLTMLLIYIALGLTVISIAGYGFSAVHYLRSRK